MIIEVRIKMSLFRHFIRRETPKNPSWMEMAMGSALKEPTPLVLPIVRNLLMHTRGDATSQADVLRWIYREGLSKASQGRKAVADWATDQLREKLRSLGRPVDDEIVYIPEDKIFSRKVIPTMAARFDHDPKWQSWLMQWLPWIMDQAAEKFEQEYEPKFIPIGNKLINIEKYNNSLPEGQPKFKFGGTDGLIEKLEDSDWAKKEVGSDPYMTDDPVRHGPDVSNPTWGRDKSEDDDETQGSDKYLYRYNKWVPPMTNDIYTNIVDDLRKHAADTISGYGAGADDPNFSPEGDDTDLLPWVRHLKGKGKLSQLGTSHLGKTSKGKDAKQDVAKLFGYKYGYTKGKYGADWPSWPQETYDFLKTLFLKGREIDAQLGKIEKHPILLNHFFDDSTRRVANRKTYGNNKTGQYSVEIAPKLIAGAEALGITVQDVIAKGLAPVQKSADGQETVTGYTHDYDDNFTYKRQYDSTVVDPEQLEKDDWRWTRREAIPEDEKSRLRKHGVTETGTMQRGEETISLKMINGQWVAAIPKQEQSIDIEQEKQDGWIFTQSDAENGVLSKKGEKSKSLHAHGGKWYELAGNKDQAHLLSTSSLKYDPDTGTPIHRGTVADHPNVVRGHSFANDKFNSIATNDWVKNATNLYGEDPLDPSDYGYLDGARGLPPSMIKATKRAISMAADKTGKDDRQLKSDIADDVLQSSYHKMHELINNKRFIYGDLDKTIKDPSERAAAAQAIARGESPEEIGDVVAARYHLKKAGIEDPDAQTMFIEKARQAQEQGRRLAPDDGVPPEAEQALLRNGYKWRSNMLFSKLYSVVLSLAQGIGKSVSSMTKLGKDGQEQGVDVSDADRLNADVLAGKDTRRRYNRANISNVKQDDAEEVQGFTELNVFKNLRGPLAQHPTYNSAHISGERFAKNHLGSFRRLVFSNRQDTPEHNTDLERATAHERNFKHRNEMFSSLKSIDAMFDNVPGSDEAKMGTVDGICDAVGNELLTSYFKSNSDDALDGIDRSGSSEWERYMTYLHHAFFVDHPRHDLAGLAKKVTLSNGSSVDVSQGIGKVKQLAAKHEKHGEISNRATTQRGDDMADTERRKQTSYREPTQTVAPQQTYYSYGSDEDDDDTPGTLPMPAEAPAPTPQPVQTPKFVRPSKEVTPPAASQPGKFVRRKVVGESLISFKTWREAGVACGTNAEFGVKAKDGGGFNYWGAAGKPGGVSIKGEIPVKKKGKK